MSPKLYYWDSSMNNSEIQDEPQITSSKRWPQEIWEIVKVLLVSLAIVLPIRYFIAQPFIVRGASMEPNFSDRQYLVIDEISYLLRAPKRGEAVVFRYPNDPSQFFIKRIIGLPNERIEIKSGKIKIFNSTYPAGFILEESYLLSGIGTHPDVVSTLDSKEYFVLGDNRNFSSDSRFWGALDRKFLIGRVIFRAWPINQFGTVSSYALNY